MRNFSSEGFIGDRASKRALTPSSTIGASAYKLDSDPLGETATEEISRKETRSAAGRRDLEAAALVHGVVEDFAQELRLVVRQLLRLKSWQGTQRIVVGGGLRASRGG
jgi:hypothetical protein